jgi:hypothetical protein
MIGIRHYIDVNWENSQHDSGAEKRRADEDAIIYRSLGIWLPFFIGAID